ncbi:MAG: tetratricopeptide repeat protein [Desulfuromonadaceae bacterium]
MTAKKKLLINILLFLGCVAIAALAVLYNYSYKICWRCDTGDYYKRGKIFVCKEDPELRESGLDFLRVAAARQQAEAQLLLAECYAPELPEGYEPVDKRAYSCLSSELGTNEAAAAEFFAKAHAELTLTRLDDLSPQVLHNLGLLREHGMLAADAPPEDYFRAAAKQDYFPAMYHLGMIYHQRSDYERAASWLEKAAQKYADPQPALVLGDYYMQGKGVPIDYEKAMHWYRQALEAVQKISVGLEQSERVAAEDVPRARMDMAMRKLQQERMFKFKTLYYRVGGDASNYEVYCEDDPQRMIGNVKRNVEGVVASIDPEVKRALSVPTPQKTFDSMNEGLEWLLNAYAKGKYGNFTRFDFRLKNPRHD